MGGKGHFFKCRNHRFCLSPLQHCPFKSVITKVYCLFLVDGILLVGFPQEKPAIAFLKIFTMAFKMLIKIILFFFSTKGYIRYFKPVAVERRFIRFKRQTSSPSLVTFHFIKKKTWNFYYFLNSRNSFDIFTA